MKFKMFCIHICIKIENFDWELSYIWLSMVFHIAHYVTINQINSVNVNVLPVVNKHYWN